MHFFMACDKKKLFFMVRGKKSLATTGIQYSLSSFTISWTSTEYSLTSSGIENPQMIEKTFVFINVDISKWTIVYVPS
jgi:hypothetical protein